MNPQKIIELESIIKDSYNNTAGVIVQREGKTLYEKYFNGCTSDSTIHIYSVTKSIVSILIGIAMDKGYIKSLNQKILDFFPDYKVVEDEKTIQNITIKDMMTMIAPYKDKAEQYLEYFTSDNWLKFALDSLGGNDEIGQFRYAPLIGPDVFSGILTKLTKQSVLDFAKANLFDPLAINIEDNIIFHSKEEQFAFYEATNISGWVADQRGINAAGWGLTLTANDMNKIGQLYLNNGLYEDKQIVSSNWVKESKKTHSKWNNLSYGYLWWIIDDKEGIYAAMGDGGNIIYINEKKKLVVVIACIFEPNAKDRVEFIRRYVESIFEDQYFDK